MVCLPDYEKTVVAKKKKKKKSFGPSYPTDFHSQFNDSELLFGFTQ